MNANTHRPRVALLWRGARTVQQPQRGAAGRLAPIFDALSAQGVAPEACVYGDDVVDAVREQILGCEAVLVWVDPISGGLDRSRLNPLLRDVAKAGVWVSALPDVIAKMGSKSVLFDTRALGWVRDVVRYDAPDELAAGILGRLHLGERRVLKQNRGNGGNGVWSVEPAAAPPLAAGPDSLITVQHALVGSENETLTIGTFARRCAAYFETGPMIDQPYQPRLVEGITRCYMVHDRVIGFSHQFSQGLLRGDERHHGPLAGKVMYGPEEPRFQGLRRSMEERWISGLQTTLDIATTDLPVIWDADFIPGPDNQQGEVSYVLCEINVSAVLPIPDDAPAAIAAAVATRLRTLRETVRSTPATIGGPP